MHKQIYNELKRVAQAQNTTTYGQIAPLADLDMSRADHRARISELLDEISRHEHGEGRPMLSAVVVHGDGQENAGMPGHGFFTLAKELKRQGKEDDLTFFAEELKGVHKAWRVSKAKSGKGQRRGR
jgi:hypothetical protein